MSPAVPASRAIFTWRMAGGLGLAIIFAVVCVLLGRWQWGRYEDKQVRAAAVTSHYTAAPVDLSSAIGRLPLSEDDQWLRVTSTGRYAASEQLLVRNRSLDGAGGLEVLVPFTPDNGSPGERLLVDRGWVANPDAATDLPSVPAAPDGTVTIEGWLRTGEPDLGKDLPAGQLASIDLGEAARQTGGSLLDAYLDLGIERTAAGTPARPAALEQPDTDLGPHQAYAFQWWLTALFGFVLLGYRAKVALAERDPGPDPRTTSASGSGGGEPTTPVPVRAKKVRIWDEEDA